MLVSCSHCKAEFEKLTGEVNRAKKKKLNIYCSRVCSGFGRRKPKISIEEARENKSEYDRQYREKNRDILKVKKAAWFQKSYDPEKARIERKKNMPRHVEYCRRPEYREKKKKYDRTYKAKKSYGQFADAFLALQDLETEVFSRQPRSEVKYQNGATNKTQNRKRDYVRQINGN